MSSAAGSFSSARSCVVHRLLLDPLGLRPRHRGVQVGQLLHDDVLRGPRARSRRSARGTAAASPRPPRPACAARPSRSPSQSLRVLRRRELELEVLLDVGLRERVGDVRRQRRIGRAELHVHEPAVADRRDRQVAQERVDRLRLRRRLVGRRRLDPAAAWADWNERRDPVPAPTSVARALKPCPAAPALNSGWSHSFSVVERLARPARGSAGCCTASGSSRPWSGPRR